VSCPLCQSSQISLFYKEAKSREFWRCQDCEYVFVPAEFHLSLEQEKARYALHENNIDDSGYQNFLMPVVEAVVKFCPARSRGLDFGCGPGPALAAILESRGYPMNLYDPFFFPDKGALDHQYDFITATEVFEHLREPRGVLVELSKLSDVLIIMTEQLGNPADFPHWYYKNDPTHIGFFSEASLRWMGNFIRAESFLVTNRLVVFKHPN